MTPVVAPMPAEIFPAMPGPGEPVFDFPCSRTQRRFWLLDRLHPGASWLNIAVRWRLEGRVEPAGLRAAFGALLQRHEILRTGIVECRGEPRQRIRPTVPVDLPVIDLTALPPDAREAEATRITLDHARSPFVLEAPPLVRACLLRLGTTEWRVLFVLHHIIGDGWSIGILMRDLAALYERQLDPDLPALPAPELHYADIANWQSEHPKPGSDPARAYWKAQLKGLQPFEIVTDRPRSTARSGLGDIATRLLPTSLTETAEGWARRQGATFFSLSVATLAVVLNRFGTERDIVIGTQLAGRTRPEMEGIVGPFINTLVLRVDAAGDPSFRILFERARAAVEGALNHAETPFEDLVEIVRPARSTTHHPLFQINLIQQRSFVPDRHHAGFALLDMPSLSPGAPYDLNFFMVERAEGWRLSCEYDVDLFGSETVGRLLALFETVLGAALANPAASIGALSTADAGDRTRIARWNETAAPIPSLSLPEAIAVQAGHGPDRSAVTCGAGSLSYAEFDRAANRLAHLLVRRGVLPGDRVGICLDRSVELPVALIAVLKAGATYVPLDPEYPPARLAMMVEDAGLAALIARRETAEAVPSAATRLLLDIDGPLLATMPGHCPDLRRAPSDIAYVLFTSGSTGRPKGVEIPDRALNNLLAAMRTSPGLGPDEVLVAVTSASFDIAALELFLPLLAGARLVMATRAETRDGGALARLLDETHATLLQATPASFQLLLDSGWGGRPSLKLLCGGEALPRGLAARLKPCGRLWNMYGPTETTIWSSALPVEDGSGTVPIGGPIANTRFEVLDEQLRPVPLGAPGELAIGGAGLARGYLGRPDLTAERFVTPSDPTLDARLYRTGDLVRWRPDGTLEFLGRIDQQIKLNGHRIELGDIEATLMSDPAVAVAAATLHRRAGQPDRIVAFIVPADPAAAAEPLIARVDAHVAARLPAYMRPSAILPLVALPLTPNGKIDRSHLIAIELPAKPQAPEPFDAAERQLAAIWHDLLGPVGIGRRSSFFDLGGDSLSGARLIERIRREFGILIPLAALFEDATFGAVARLVETPMTTTRNPAVMILRQGGARPPLWGIATPTIFLKLAARLTLDRPFHVVRLPDETIDAILAYETLEQIADHYLHELRRAQPSGPYALLGFCSDAAVAFEMARQLEDMNETVDLLVLVDAWAPAYSHRLGRVRGVLADVEYELRRSLDIGWRLVRGLWLAVRTGRPKAIKTYLPQSDPVYGASAAYRLHAHTTDRVKAARPRGFGGSALVVRSGVQPAGLFLDRDLGWASLVRGKLRVITVPGDHLGIFSEPGVGALAAGIGAFDRGVPDAGQSP
jgi:amino acid adenylation domain-containing protein